MREFSVVDTEDTRLQPHGLASIEVVKQHLAIYFSSGPEWTDRMKRIASRATSYAGNWVMTE
ncbi:hypothetical protein [Bradyrhizobium diazoefficiens]|uniref:hypothetical protein n=1 Tax=Bradyrhizobium diazoefficiens TaxID=1355477 RepID=UPI002714677E|nr:hypothetical protein [Bradyrhizobium diazoefficiens]WLC17999.1 hypothetical protein QIH76_06685 [Bradyrhizobium diazoefficiens]